MTPPDASDQSQLDAQQRVDAIKTFERELAALEADGVLQLSDAQRGAIAAHHAGLVADLKREFDVDRDDRGKQLSLGMRVASLLGALAFAASVFMLFRQYWGHFGTSTQVLVLTATALLSFAGTAWVRALDHGGYFTKLAALVSWVCFVLNIAMMGQIFNITPSDKALLAWGAYALLLAYACDLKLLLAAGLLCLIAFTSARVGEWSGMYWLDLGKRPENLLPVAILTFGASLYLAPRRYSGFAATYRLVGLLTLLGTVLGLSFWGAASYLPWDDTTIEHCYQTLGFVLSAAAIGLGARRFWRETTNAGVAFFVIFLFTKFYDWWWESMPKYLFFLVLGLTALLALTVMRRLRLGAARQAGEGA